MADKNSTSVTPFVFPGDGKAIRSLILPNGEPGFVGKDVAERLGYADTSDAVKRHCKGEKMHAKIRSNGGAQKFRVISVDDFVSMAVGSTLPGAKEFAESVCGALGLPSLVLKRKRAEVVFGEEIVERLFSGYTIIRQFPVFGGKYRIDWYVPELRLAVEFDEAHHATSSNAAADAARQSEIEAALGCRFLRYSQKG